VDHSGTFLYSLCLGLVAGIAAALLFGVTAPFLFISVGLAGGLLLIGIVLKNKIPFLLSIFIIATVLGTIRTEVFLQNQQAQSLLPYVSDSATVVGKVVNDPERRATSLHVDVAVSTIDGKPAQGELLAILNRDELVAYGDTITVAGSVEEPQPFETNTGHLFDYEGYLEAQGVSAMIPQATLVGRKSGGISAQGILFSIKHYFEYSVERLFPEPDGSLLEGILLGERRTIPQSLTQAFVASSLVHVVVLSGHNITIVSEGVFRALAFLSRTGQYATGAVLMFLFAAMTGFGTTTVRALIMALVALLARYQHRSALALRSLAVAAAAMVLWNPSSLLHDPSFILSVLATFGLITFAPWVEQKLWRVPNYKRFDIRSIMATTIAVEIFVTPALLYFSGTFSVFAVPANLLALPAIPLAMFLGFVSGLVGFVSPTAALVPVLLCDLLLKWMILVAITTEHLPYSTAIAPQFSGWLLAVSYIPLTAFAILRYRSALK